MIKFELDFNSPKQKHVKEAAPLLFRVRQMQLIRNHLHERTYKNSKNWKLCIMTYISFHL